MPRSDWRHADGAGAARLVQEGAHGCWGSECRRCWGGESRGEWFLPQRILTQLLYLGPASPPSGGTGCPLRRQPSSLDCSPPLQLPTLTRPRTHKGPPPTTTPHPAGIWLVTWLLVMTAWLHGLQLCSFFKPSQSGLVMSGLVMSAQVERPRQKGPPVEGSQLTNQMAVPPSRTPQRGRSQESLPLQPHSRAATKAERATSALRATNQAVIITSPKLVMRASVPALKIRLKNQPGTFACCDHTTPKARSPARTKQLPSA